MGKKVASTLANIHSDPRVSVLRDLSDFAGVMKVADTMRTDWSYDLYTRKPGPAYVQDGVFKGTDLDLACFLAALIERGAVIELPVYKSRRASVKRDNERTVQGNRHGKVRSLVSNKNVFSFSVQVTDMNVVVTNPETGEEHVGAPRNFMLQDIDGKWHDGWRSIGFRPSAKENDFLADNELWTGSAVIFKNFIHPNRWVSFYGRNYFLLKLMIARLDLERKFLAGALKQMQEDGIKFPKGHGGKKIAYVPGESGEAESIEVDAFEAEIDFGEFEGAFTPLAQTSAALKDADVRMRLIRYTLMPIFRFYARTVEYAFYKRVCNNDGVESFPGWISNAKWERDYREAGKRKRWNRLVLGQTAPGVQGHAIRYRIYKKKERISTE